MKNNIKLKGVAGLILGFFLVTYLVAPEVSQGGTYELNSLNRVQPKKCSFTLPNVKWNHVVQSDPDPYRFVIEVKDGNTQVYVGMTPGSYRKYRIPYPFESGKDYRIVLHFTHPFYMNDRCNGRK